MSSLMDILYHSSPVKESKNAEIVRIWGVGCSLDTNPSSFLSRCSQIFQKISPFFFILYLQILLYML